MSDEFTRHCAQVLARWGWDLADLTWHYVPGSTTATMACGPVTDRAGRRKGRSVIVGLTARRMRWHLRRGLSSQHLDTTARLGCGGLALVGQVAARLSVPLTTHPLSEREANWLAVAAADLTAATRGKLAAIPEATTLVGNQLRFHLAAATMVGEQLPLLHAYLQDLALVSVSLAQVRGSGELTLAQLQRFAYRGARLLETQVPEFAPVVAPALAGWESSQVPCP